MFKYECSSCTWDFVINRNVTKCSLCGSGKIEYKRMTEEELKDLIETLNENLLELNQ